MNGERLLEETLELVDLNHKLEKVLAEWQSEEQEYQVLFDNANEIIYVHDLEGRFLSVNKVGLQILGYSMDNVEKYSVFDVIPEEHRALFKERLMQKAQGRLHSPYELEVIHSNGERLAMEISTRLITRNGKPYAIQGVARDITERNQVELALIESEQRLMDIINFLPDATFVISNEGKIIAWNRAIEKMTGIKARDIMGKGNYEYALPFYGKRRPILIDLVLSPDAVGRNKYLSIEVEHNHLSGESFCPGIGYNGAILYGTASPLYDAAGNTVGAIESIRDITERKNTEQRMQDIIDFLPDATLVIDRDGRVIAWNRAIEKMTGIKARDIMGKGNYEYALPFYGQRRPILIDLVLTPDAVGRDKYLSIEVEHNHLSGESCCPGIGYNGAILYGTASPLYDATGNIVGAIESIRDITERKNTEQRLQDIIDFLPDATMVIDREGRVITWNRAMESMTGIKGEDMIGKGQHEYALPFFGKRQPILIDQVCSPQAFPEQNGNVLSVEHYCPAIGPDGLVLYGKASPLYDVTGTMVGAIETLRDITKRRKMEEALRTSEENFRKLAEIAPAMIFVMQDERLIYVNKTTEHITGYTQSELLNQSPWFVVHPDCREWASASLLAWQQKMGIADRDQIKLMHKEGAVIWLDLSVTPIEFSGQPSILGVGIDITENKLAADEIRYLSYHDKLTGLYNRAYFEEILPSFERSQYMPLSLIMGDLNGLKMINDAFGHLKGDQLLQKVARVLQFCCRPQDVIARWGGDEFVVLLPNTDENEAAKISDRISKSCRYLEGFPVQVSIALGVATQKSIVRDFEEVSKEAEDRMYRTKLLESKSNRSSFMSSLEKTLRVRSHETQAHTQRLRNLLVEIARSLRLPSSDIHNLTLLATLHDIGKIAIPNSILDKPGPLSEDEWEIMKKHPEIGYRIALSSPELAVIAEAILTHHERWDGNGYPMRLKAEGIPLHARILAIADAYDVMVSGRPYQKALTRVDALKEIKRCAGSQFDPELAGLFVSQVESDFAPQELEAYCNQAENLLDMHG